MTSRPARERRSGRSTVAAEAILSPEARRIYDTLTGKALQRVNDAILAIEAEPDWRDGRYLAPADSPNSGLIVDFSPSPYAIVYRVRDRGAVVWIEKIQAVIF